MAKCNGQMLSNNKTTTMFIEEDAMVECQVASKWHKCSLKNHHGRTSTIFTTILNYGGVFCNLCKRWRSVSHLHNNGSPIEWNVHDDGINIRGDVGDFD